jgi:hypothetical protein
LKRLPAIGKLLKQVGLDSAFQRTLLASQWFQPLVANMTRFP